MKIRWIGLGLLSTVLVGCASGVGSSTVYTAADMDILAVDMKDQLASSGFLANRTPDAPEIVLSPRSMENRSNERLSRVDKWAAVSRVLNDPAVFGLLTSKNVRIVMPQEGQWLVTTFGASTDATSSDIDPYRGTFRNITTSNALRPTHVLDARFSSLTRAGADDTGAPADRRKDLFVIDFTITDVRSREIVWAGSHEFARYSHGVLAN